MSTWQLCGAKKAVFAALCGSRGLSPDSGSAALRGGFPPRHMCGCGLVLALHFCEVLQFGCSLASVVDYNGVVLGTIARYPVVMRGVLLHSVC